MSKTIKVLSVINGAEVEVATCHPGQARILQKRGLASWKSGKLYLMDLAEAETPDGESPKDSVVPMGPLEIQVASVVVGSTLQEILEDAGVVDYLEWADLVSTGGGTPRMSNVEVDSTGALFREFAQRISLGHKTHYYEDIHALTLGFLDLDADEYVCMAISCLRKSWSSQSVINKLGLGLTAEQIQEALGTREGREKLFGRQDSFWGNEEAETEEGRPIPYGLWGEAPQTLLDTNPTVGSSVRTLNLSPSSNIDEFLTKLDAAHDGFHFPTYPGWTSFKWPGCEEVLPVFDAPGRAHPPIGHVRFNAKGHPDRGFRYGLYRRVGSKLYRVWNEEREVHWDESILSDDGTYRLSQEFHHDTMVNGMPLTFRNAVGCAEAAIRAQVDSQGA
jgi:hypothetical protein